MSLAIQLTRILLFSLFTAIATGGLGIWDAETGTLTVSLSIDSIVQAIFGAGGFLVTLGWWKRANKGEN